MEYVVTRRDSELYHHGVKGMKWGVRKNNYTTVRDGLKTARRAGMDARKAARESGQLSGIGAVRKGNKIQRDAARASLNEQKTQKNSSNTLKTVGKAAGKALERSREKSEKRKKSYETTTDIFGVGGAALRSYTEYQSKKFVKGFAANVINASANAYIANNSANNYRVARGVDFVRNAAVKGLSLSTRIDEINAYANVARSAMYASNRGKR